MSIFKQFSDFFFFFGRGWGRTFYCKEWSILASNQKHNKWKLVTKAYQQQIQNITEYR